jgi:TATA-box binding protein (TBP) (component of TFIID and TFIIIB)
MALSTTTINNIDDEWSNFITNNYDDNSSTDEENNLHDEFNEKNIELNSTEIYQGIAPEPTPIYISTKSKIAYLEQPVDLRIFWKIPVISYATPENGVIKKQIKINSKTPEELLEIQSRLTKELYFEEHIMSHIDNPNGRIKFKDIRKITIGISKKDIMSYRSKKKQAFYNCFVMIIRIKIAQSFREFHIKVFNTGKLEIPGVQSEEMFETVLKTIIDILQPFHDYTLSYKQTSDTVLINSNFNCGFFINREILFDILRSKYTIQAIYDPCSYPGIQCKFYYNNDIGIQTGKQISSENKNKYQNITEVSFMIFRTGSVLIVGMCDENILQEIYGFLKALLKEEFKYICQKLITPDNYVKDKKKKIRKKIINIFNESENDNDNDNDSVKIIPAITEEFIVVTKKPKVKKIKNNLN